MIRGLMLLVMVVCYVGWIAPAMASVFKDGSEDMPMQKIPQRCAIVLDAKGMLPCIKPAGKTYGFTHFIGQATGYNSEHSWTTGDMPEIKIDEEKKARVANNKAEDENLENDGNPYGICRLNGWDTVCTYIDCPICGKKMWIDVDNENSNKQKGVMK